MLLAQPLKIAGDLRRVGEQRRERLAPFRFHALDEPAFAAFQLRALELKPVLFLAQGGQRLAGLIERPFSLAEVCLSHADLRFGVSGGRFELGQRETALVQRLRPLRALGREARRVALDTRNLVGSRPGLLARPLGVGSGAAGALRRGRVSRFHLRGLDLPAHALLARCVLLCLQIGEPGALGAQLLRRPDALDFALLQLDVQRTEARRDLREPLGQPLDLCGRLFGLAAGVDHPAIRFSLFGARLQLGAPRLFRLVTRGGQRGFSRRQLLDRRLFGPPRAIEILRGFAYFLLQSLQLRASLERSRRWSRAVEEHGAVGPAQRARTNHLVAGDQRPHPRGGRAIYAQLIMQRMAVRTEARPRHSGQQHQRTWLRFGMPRADRVDDRCVAHQHGMQPFAQQSLRPDGRLRVPAGPLRRRFRLAAGGPRRRLALPALVTRQRQLLAQLAALTIQGRALDFERACCLGTTLERFLQLADGEPLGGEAAAHRVFFAGPRTELRLHRGEVTLGSSALGGRRLVFALRLRRSAFRLHPLVRRRLPPTSEERP